MNYYNEWEPFAGEWLKELIKDGLIPDGTVDNRSIADVEPSDLKGFTQCHFFAGIGGWSRALELARWSPERPVWTGSPPCQSFSAAGKGKGKDDLRHLWPVFFNLIRECQPPTVFGEQVAAAIRFGWLDDLQIDFEKEGYAAGAFVLPAGSIGAFHKRDRLFFTAKRVVNSNSDRSQQGNEAAETAGHRDTADSAGIRADSVAYSSSKQKHQEQQRPAENEGKRSAINNSGCSVDDEGLWDLWENPQIIRSDEAYSCLGDTEHDGSYEAKIGRSTGLGEAKGGMLEPKRSDSLFWGSSEVIYCRDGKYRPIPTEPALFPLADGIPNRVGILRGAGNAIVPQAAAEIIKAYMETYTKLE